MSRTEKYNKTLTGVLTGLLIPVVAMLLFSAAKNGDISFASFLRRLVSAGVLTNTLSVAVFINVFAFLLFNRLDMLKASKGILGITIVWAILVLTIRFV